MTRYGWSLGWDASSPYGSMSSLPEVGDDDFSYITSQDLDDPGMGYSDSHRHQSRIHQSAAADLEDDILMIKNKGVAYPAHFPAYSIGDGKLHVKDVRERVALMMDLSSRSAKRIKLLYKGKQLKDSLTPIRDYGVKNKSEIMAVIPDGDDDSSLSGEDGPATVNAGETSRGADHKVKSRGKKKRGGRRRPDKTGAESPTSPRDSALNLDSPKSPQSASAAASGQLKKLAEIADDFKTKWLPLCREFIEAPPTDLKKREEEHRRLSESIMQHVILKCDGVETDGMIEVRTRRKEVVAQVQAVLNELDAAAKAS